MTAAPISSHARALTGLGLPLIGSNVAQFSLHLTNTVMLGWYEVTALAAAALAVSFFVLFQLAGSAFGWAVMPLVAAAAAQGDEPLMRRSARMAVWLSALFALIVMPVMIWSGPLLRLLGQAPEVTELAQIYLRIAAFGLFPALFATVMRGYLAGQGRTQVVLWVTTLAVPVNAAVNWVTIFGRFGWPEMGVAGAAMASVLVQILSAVLLGLYVAFHPALRRQRMFQRFWRLDGPELRRVFALGWPIALTNLSEAGLFNATAVMMGWMGTAALAAHGICLELASFTFMIHMGISNAATIRTGGFFGQEAGPDLRRGALVALALSTTVAALVIVVYLAVPEALVSAFIAPGEPQREAVLAVGVTLLTAAAVFQLGDAMQAMALGLLRGVQDARVPMLIAAFSYWLVGIPASYVLGFHTPLGPQGIWLGLACGLVLAAVLLLRRFYGRVRDWPTG